LFEIKFTPKAIDNLVAFRKYDQQFLITAIQQHLSQQPNQETRNHKRLRPNILAEWELRLGAFRVFYDIDQQNCLVKVEAIGYKQGSTLFLAGEEYTL